MKKRQLYEKFDKFNKICMAMLLALSLSRIPAYAEEGDDDKIIITDDTGTSVDTSGDTTTEGPTVGDLEEVNVNAVKALETALEATKKAEAVDDALKVQTTQIEALTASQTALTQQLTAYYNADPADNPANPTLWRGLDADKTIYIYSIQLTDGTKLYTGSNTASLRIYRNDSDTETYMRVDNAYIKNDKQQVTVFYDDIAKAESLLWGYSTVSYNTRNAPAWGGKGGWGTYTYYTIQYPDNPTETDVQGTLAGTLTQYYITDNGDPRPGNAKAWAGKLTLEKTIKPGTAATINGIYTTTLLTLCVMLFATFKRGGAKK